MESETQNSDLVVKSGLNPMVLILKYFSIPEYLLLWKTILNNYSRILCFQMYKLGLGKVEEPEIKMPAPVGS